MWEGLIRHSFYLIVRWEGLNVLSLLLGGRGSMFFHLNNSRTHEKLGNSQNNLSHLSLASFLGDIGKQYSPRYDSAEWGVPSLATLFAKRIFIKNVYENLKPLLRTLKLKMDLRK